MVLDDRSPHYKRIFITVGTFKFDKLIERILSDEVLNNLNYEQLIIQYGNGNHPKRFNANFKFIEMTDECTKSWEYLASNSYFPAHGCFRFYKIPETFFNIVNQADLVITHAGAGTLLDLMRNPLNKSQIVAVSNPDLLDDHQTHLISKLNYYNLIASGLDNLEYLTSEFLIKIKSSKVDKIPPPDTKVFLKELEMLTGYSFQ